MIKRSYQRRNFPTYWTSFDNISARQFAVCVLIGTVLMPISGCSTGESEPKKVAQGTAAPKVAPGPSLKAPEIPSNESAAQPSTTVDGSEKDLDDKALASPSILSTSGTTSTPSTTASLSRPVGAEESAPGEGSSAAEGSVTVSEPAVTQNVASASPSAAAEPLASATLSAPTGENVGVTDKTEKGKKELLVEPRTNGTPLTVATAAEKNQQIASDWPKPWATLFVTGQQKGYIEPCGCTGLENQKGGLNRRDTLLKLVRDRGWDVIPLDAGNQVRRKGRQAEMIFRFSADAMANMGYRAIALGEEDLHLSSAELLQITASEGNQRTAFTSCNVSIVDPSLMNPWQVIEVNQRKIGVTSVLGKSKQRDISSDEIVLDDPVTSLQKALAGLKEQKCDYYVLLAHANLTESAEFAKLVPGFDLIVTAGGEGEPTYLPEPIEGTKSLMVQVGVKGMYVGLVGLFDDANNPVRYQRVALSSQFSDSPRMMEAFQGYQEQLQKQGFQRLEVVPVSHPTGRTFVGTESCSECHSTAFEVWKNSAHAHATQSLIKPGERSEIARHFDPECLSCHVTGWNPQKFYPYETGYLSVDKTPLMMENGCENCHGPGSQHVAAENGDIEADEALLKTFREEMRIPLAQAQEKCLECHDIDNSPNFHQDGAFEEFWEQVKHYGKD